ncbi:SDR family NAD(P)-dependent oxidoreductase [Mycobacterium paraseoulense]|nr:SDR family NAD(P)-dependent oxidoreductase [Mycobacterium paraseoulense]
MTQQVFSGASAIVTGGAGGLGEATVRRLHADGLKVVIADLADDKGHKLADELGEGTVFVNTDVANDDSVAGAIAKASELDTLRYAVITHGGFGGRPERIVGRDGQSAPHRQCAAIRPGWPPSSAPTGGHHSK